MLPTDGYRLGRGSLGPAMLAELTVQVAHVPLSVGKLPHVVRDASKDCCTFVTHESLAQSPLHPSLPGQLDDRLRILRHAFLRGRRTLAFCCRALQQVAASERSEQLAAIFEGPVSSNARLVRRFWHPYFTSLRASSSAASVPCSKSATRETTTWSGRVPRPGVSGWTAFQ